MKPAAALAVALALACTPGSKGADPAESKPTQLEAGPWKFGQPQPGIDGYTSELVAALDAKWAARSAKYAPRTRHLSSDGSPKYTNRLYLESSPYLLQHAHNPVNWYPWGTEAFETARRLGRPVLLSVGYSTCHWCHVMEEQSFEDEHVARYLNEHYVAIKVDREERPDVDEIYMTAVRNMSGRGGWPMTVWLTPDRTPFHGGTYFPKARFMSSLTKMSELYANNPRRVASTSADVVAAIRASLEPEADPATVGLPDAAVLAKAARLFRGRFDTEWGGVVGARKFPSSLPVRFLLRYHRRTGDKAVLHAALFSLEKMAAGGMYDHVGGGFHRYSTDPKWLVPHFEKMLYDNALLISAYLEAHEITGREQFARVARETLRWVERDMTSPEGAFYSATDADSLTPAGHREEGYFFTWTPAELSAVLTDEATADVTAYWGVTSTGNFEGRTILNAREPLASVAVRLGKRPEALRATVDAAREALYIERAKRPPPLRDEKILTAWNGLMISAHANAAVALREPTYAERGANAMRFVLAKLRSSNGRLLRSYMDGRARHNGYLDDYAFCIAALLDLFEATSEPIWLREAIALDALVEAHYEDKLNGGFFFTSDDHEKLLARDKPRYDGAVPTGNSVHVLNLLRLEELTGKQRYRQRAELAMGVFDALLRRAPSAMSEMLNAIDFYLDLPKQIVIVTPTSASEAEPLLATLAASFVPNRVLVVATESEAAQRAVLTPLVEDKIARDGKATAYVCERRVCQLPTSDPAVFAKQIRKVRPLR